MQSVRSRSIVRKIGKVGLLLSIKESYLFVRNSLGLTVHPFKTLRELKREKDRSQQVLVLGWPVYVLMLGLFGVWIGRRVFSTTVEWGLLAKASFFGVVSMTMLVGVYLGYWILRVWSVGGRDERVR
jgi:hypothetical protein